jgi:hypothetical protein
MDVFHAVKYGDLEHLREVLTRDNVSNVSGGGLTALHHAVNNGHTECVKYLLEMDANVNARTDGGSTPLHCAIQRGDVDTTHILLGAGAVADATDKDGQTPLYRAVLFNHREVARLLIDQGARIANVKLDGDVQLIPAWIHQITSSRSLCRSVAIVVIGIHKYHRTNITGNNDVNVLKLIGKHIWSMRMP